MSTQNVEAFAQSLSGHDVRTNTTSPVANLGELGRFLKTVGAYDVFVLARYGYAGENITAKAPCMFKKIDTGATPSGLVCATMMMTDGIDDICRGVPTYAIDSGLWGWFEVDTPYFAGLVVDSAAFTAGTSKVCVSGTASKGKLYDPASVWTTTAATDAELLAASQNTYSIFAEALDTDTVTALDCRLFCR